MSLLNEDGYRKWLAKHAGYDGRVLGDAVSRTRRAARLINLGAAKSEDDVDVLLIRSREFQACSVSVRSQIRRAAKFYIQFRTGAKA